MRRNDILEKKDLILKWINENRSNAYMCRELKCKPDTLRSYMAKMGITYKGNQGNKGYSNGDTKLSAEEYAKSTYVKSHKLLNKLIEDGLKEWKCEKCGNSKWNDLPIPLELHHKDGEHSNNDLDNLLLLCPNCHAQTPNFRGKNKKIYKKSNQMISDKDFKKALIESENISQALKSLGLAPKGANYSRAKRLMEEI